jgi:hypothetical protein
VKPTFHDMSDIAVNVRSGDIPASRGESKDNRKAITKQKNKIDRYKLEEEKI